MSATKARTPSLHELLLTEHMDGDFLIGCGRSVGNEGGPVGLSEARPSEVATWALEAVSMYLAQPDMAETISATLVEHTLSRAQAVGLGGFIVLECGCGQSWADADPEDARTTYWRHRTNEVTAAIVDHIVRGGAA